MENTMVRRKMLQLSFLIALGLAFTQGKAMAQPRRLPGSPGK
jgi:hypothetical protein